MSIHSWSATPKLLDDDVAARLPVPEFARDFSLTFVSLLNGLIDTVWDIVEADLPNLKQTIEAITQEFWHDHS